MTGDLTTGGKLVPQNNVMISGTLTQGATLKFPDLAGFTLAFPTTTQGDQNLEPDQSRPLAPGSFGAVTVKSRATLSLRTGTYYLRSLSLEPQATVKLDTTRGPVFVYVKDAFAFKGAFVDSRGRSDDLLVGYFGQSDAFVETTFNGTLVAPRAKVWLRNASAPHRGSFFAKQLDLAADARIVNVPFPLAWSIGTRAVLGAEWRGDESPEHLVRACGCRAVGSNGNTASIVSLAAGLAVSLLRRRKRAA